MSNTIVSLAFRIALPVAMLAMLFYTLMAADREQSTWIAQRDSAQQKAVTNSDIESIPFVLPFQHSARIQVRSVSSGQRLLSPESSRRYRDCSTPKGDPLRPHGQVM